MTDFAHIDLTVASTRGDSIHNAGFHIQGENNLSELREIVGRHDSNIQLRVEDARMWTLDKSVKWVWIRLNDNTPGALLRELSQAVKDNWLYPAPNEYP